MELREEYPTFSRDGYLRLRGMAHERPTWTPEAFYDFKANRPRLSPQGILTLADKRELARRLVKYGMEI